MALGGQRSALVIGPCLQSSWGRAVFAADYSPINGPDALPLPTTPPSLAPIALLGALERDLQGSKGHYCLTLQVSGVYTLFAVRVRVCKRVYQCTRACYIE